MTASIPGACGSLPSRRPPLLPLALSAIVAAIFVAAVGAMPRDAAAQGTGDAPAGKPGDEDPIARGQGPGAGRMPELVDGDWSECRTLVIPASAPATVPADARALPDLPPARPAALVQGGPDSFFEKVSGVLANRSSGGVCAVIRDSKPGVKGSTRLQFVDRATGKASPPVTLDSMLMPVDLSPSGDLILARSEPMFAMEMFGGEQSATIGVWRVAKHGLEPVARWKSKAPGHVHDRLLYACFVDEDHVLGMEFPGFFTLWNVPARKAVWHVALLGAGYPAISPGGRYVAIPFGQAVIVLDALGGETVAMLPCPTARLGAVAFSIDGSRLAGVGTQQVKVWDLATGELAHDFALSESMFCQSILWTDRNHLLVDGSALVDLTRRVVLWRYRTPWMGGFAATAGGGGTDIWFAAASPDLATRALVPLRLPHEQARQRAAGLDADRLLAIRPGTAIELEMRVDGDAAGQERVRQGLLRQIAAAGLVVQEGAPVRLQAVTETGETRDTFIRTAGSSNVDPEKVPVRDSICQLRVFEGDRLLWRSMTSTGPPAFLLLEEGQSIHEALAPYQGHDLAFFEHTPLPRVLARQGDGGSYGSSDVTPEGLQSTPQAPPEPGIL